MKFMAAIAGALLVPAALAHAAPAPLAGVEDQETDIPSGRIMEYHEGKGDVIFVRHETDRWYRVQLSEGCLDTGLKSDGLVFDRAGADGRVDRFTRVVRPATGVSCSIRSIRRSAPPPQIDSDSPVTLD
jgi:hypothetical protein